MPDSGTLNQEVDQLRQEVRALKEHQADHPGVQDGAETRSSPPEAGDRGEEKRDKPKHPYRKWLILAGVVIAAIVITVWWLHSRHYEDTDDAQVDGHISGVASRISGTIIGVYVEENQFVHAGQVLIDLDPRDYQVAVEKARAQIRQAQSQIRAEQPNVPVTQVTTQTAVSTAQATVASGEAALAAAQRDYDSALARIKEAQANSVKAQRDVERYQPLVAKDEIPRQQFDTAVAAADASSAAVAANQSAADAARKLVDQRRAELQQDRERLREAQRNAPQQIAIRQANVQTQRSAMDVARAQLGQALLNLSYCKITSPVSGIVAKRAAEVGAGVAPGQDLLMITQTDDLWVTANFRETQLRRMKPGQFARIHVDALDADFDGYVESMPAATGSITSLLPPENATGNYVKVVQRLPVRIRFKAGQAGLDRLRPGMSVEPKVTVQ